MQIAKAAKDLLKAAQQKKMEKRYIRNGISEHHGKDWSPKLLDMSLNTFLDKLKEVDPKSYDKVESIIEKHKGGIVKESGKGRINPIKEVNTNRSSIKYILKEYTETKKV